MQLLFHTCESIYIYTIKRSSISMYFKFQVCDEKSAFLTTYILSIIISMWSVLVILRNKVTLYVHTFEYVKRLGMKGYNMLYFY